MNYIVSKCNILLNIFQHDFFFTFIHSVLLKYNTFSVVPQENLYCLLYIRIDNWINPIRWVRVKKPFLFGLLYIYTLRAFFNRARFTSVTQAIQFWHLQKERKSIKGKKWLAPRDRRLVAWNCPLRELIRNP
jgi:hypothetical protein